MEERREEPELAELGAGGGELDKGAEVEARHDLGQHLVRQGVQDLNNIKRYEEKKREEKSDEN